jgi:hypothetical protein
MPKTKTPALHDWSVSLEDASFGSALTIRASSLTIIEGAYVLRDTYGGILFAAPARTVRCIRRLEPGEEPPVPAFAGVAGPFEPVKPVPGDAHIPEPEPPAAEKVTPAPRPRTTRRK